MTSYEDLGLFAFGLPGKVIFFFFTVSNIYTGIFSLPFLIKRDKYIQEKEIQGNERKWRKTEWWEQEEREKESLFLCASGINKFNT